MRGAMIVKIRILFFLIGAVLFFTSLPLGSKMIMELIHDQKMDAAYKVTPVNNGYPPTGATFNFKGKTVEIRETLKEEESYMDPWQNRMDIADLSLLIDGEEIDTLQGYPVRAQDEGLNRYYGEVAFLLLEDKKKNRSHLIILLKKTRELQREMPNGDIVGWVPVEELKYTLYSIDEDGNVHSSSFGFSDRDGLQTKLLNAGAVVPYSIGYYTDAWQAYPTILFPFVFPFATLILGLLMMLLFFPMRKAKKQ